MTFRVTILGSSSAMPTVRKNPTAHVLNVHEQFFLIDCGEGTQVQLQRYGVNPQKIDRIFISHLHGDHLYGIFGLISTLGLLGRKHVLEIYAPRPFDEILANHLAYFDKQLPYNIEWREVHTRKHELLYENKVVEVYSIPLRHRVPCAGFLFREKTPPLNVCKDMIDRYGLGLAQIVAAKRGEDIFIDEGDDSGLLIPNKQLTYRPYEPRSYAYISDTEPSAKAAELICGVDLLYHESTFMDEERSLARATGHSTTLDAAKIAIKSEAKRLLIGHFSSRYKNDELLVTQARTIFTNTDAALQGESYNIEVKDAHLR